MAVLSPASTLYVWIERFRIRPLFLHSYLEFLGESRQILLFLKVNIEQSLLCSLQVNISEKLTRLQVDKLRHLMMKNKIIECTAKFGASPY